MVSHGIAEKPQVSHKDVCIPFTVTDEDGTKYRFEAVGFLEDDEEYVTTEAALASAGNRVVRSDEDWERIYNNREQLHDELLEFAQLITKRPCPDCPGAVSCLGWYDRVWIVERVGTANICFRDSLVLRRSA